MSTPNEAADHPTPEHPESGDLILGNALMQTYDWSTDRALAFVDAVHAAERRATVERIRHALILPNDSGWIPSGEVQAILDEEAAR